MIDKKHIDSFSVLLTIILNEEIKLGNKIIETSKGWPHENTIMVFLEKPFKSRYDSENRDVEFRNINDPYYWKAEYFDMLTNHILACKF